MDSSISLIEEIPKEKELNTSNISLGQRSPKINHKLDDTFPSILHLSENSNIENMNKTDSFNLDNLSLKTDFSLLKNNKNFIKGHYKAFSNEIFSIPKILNFYEINQKNEIFKDNKENEFYYYNLKSEINLEKSNNIYNEEELKNNILFEDLEENVNNLEDEEESDGFYILNILRKFKKNVTKL